MSRSVLLQLARDSIVEVLQAETTINTNELTSLHPLLNETIPTIVNIYINEEIRGTYKHKTASSLIDNIIIGSKRAAFEDKHFSPMTTSEYLHCEIELILQTPDGAISEKDPAILKEEDLKITY